LLLLVRTNNLLIPHKENDIETPPYIFLTPLIFSDFPNSCVGNLVQEDIDLFLKAGADRLVGKPFTKQIIEDVLKEYGTQRN
jgi:hypothetical protein